jgi:hypothetical protein
MQKWVIEDGLAEVVEEDLALSDKLQFPMALRDRSSRLHKGFLRRDGRDVDAGPILLQVVVESIELSEALGYTIWSFRINP